VNKLSWNEHPEITNLDTALVNLGFAFHKGEVPGIAGECYIIDNYTGKKQGTFVIKVDEGHRNVYRLYQIIPRWETNYSSLEYLTEDLKSSLDFYGN